MRRADRGDPYSRYLVFERWKAIALSYGDQKAADEFEYRACVVYNHDLTQLERDCLDSRSVVKVNCVTD